MARCEGPPLQLLPPHPLLERSCPAGAVQLRGGGTLHEACSVPRPETTCPRPGGRPLLSHLHWTRGSPPSPGISGWCRSMERCWTPGWAEWRGSQTSGLPWGGVCRGGSHPAVHRSEVTSGEAAARGHGGGPPWPESGLHGSGALACDPRTVQGPRCSESRCTALGALWGDRRGQRAAQDSGAPACDPRPVAPRQGALRTPWSPCGDSMSMPRPSVTCVQDPPLLCLVWSRGEHRGENP